MPKRKLSLQQPSLFPKRSIPQMPEGYYSSGPNPNLRRFVEEHATPYDPATDGYNVPPFDKPITTTKATAIYNMHTYWSKKPHDAIREYIKHYTKPGDIVLDPFCGSGGTALAALMEGRAAIAIDLSPAATFITKNYCTPVDVDDLQRAFEELQRKVKPEMDWLYETRCDRCDGRAMIGYTVFSYVFQCKRCLERVPLFDCVTVMGEKEKELRVCPNCYARGVIEEISTRSERFDPVPVLVSYLCKDGCKPQRDERCHNDLDPKKREYFVKYDLGKINEIEQKAVTYFYPDLRMLNSHEGQREWGLLWRPYHGNIAYVNHFFTKRNLWALATILDKIKSLESEALLFAFQGNILSASIMQQYREAGGGFAKGTYYVPSIFMEREQQSCFQRKVDDVNSGLREVTEGVRSTNLLISTQSVTNIGEIDANSVDYIFTDPPYGGKVQYGELNFIWEAWLNFDTHWHDKEIIVNEVQNKSDDDWATLMQKALDECYRVLKPGRWISLCYHDTSEGTWQLIQDLASEIGFIPETTENTLFIDSTQKSWKQLVASEVTKRDLVINFRKPKLGEIGEILIITGDEDTATFTEKARLILGECLETHPGATADRLYDELVSRMVRRGEFERHNFDELLRSVAEEANGRWYLLDTAGLVDETESAKEAAAAKRLEEFMLKTLLGEKGKGGKDETAFSLLPLSALSPHEGVHYSDLFEQYLPIKDKPRRLLQDWLPEFFYKTPEGTWRPPVNDEERQQKAALRSSGALRKIKRFANALVDGVPPAERDKPENAVTLADWIRQCRRAGLFELGRVMYEKGGLRFEELSEETRLLVEEDYQICVGRSGKEEKGKWGKGKKLAEQASLFSKGEE